MLTLYWSLAASAAAPPPPVDAVSWLQQGLPIDGVRAALGCAELNDLSALLDRAGMLRAGAGPMSKAMVGSAELEGLGLDRTAPARLVTGVDGQLRVDLPFAGDAAAAEALLRKLEIEPTPVAAGAWSDATGTIGARLNAGRLELSGSPEGGGAAIARSDLLDGLHAPDGCALLIGVPGGIGLGLGDLMPREIAVAGSLDGSALQARWTTSSPPPALLQGGVLPLDIHTTTPPSLVVSLGFTLDELLAEPAFAERAAPMKERLRPFLRRFAVPGGTTVAVFGGLRGSDRVLVVPLERDSGRLVGSRRISRLVGQALAEQDQPYQPWGAHGFQVEQAEGPPVYVGASRGRVVAGVVETRVVEVLADKGAPWVPVGAAAPAESWPLVVVVGAGMIDLWPSRVSLGIGASEGHWQAGVIGSPEVLMPVVAGPPSGTPAAPPPG
jgi:hypothetical protein